MKRRTKIVCTLGPASSSAGKIKGLIDAGMNMARLNCSHGDWDGKREMVEHVRSQSPEVGKVAILADLQGPKFRIGDFQGGFIDVSTGQNLTLGQDPEDMIQVPGDEIFEAMETGDRLLMGDGDVEFKLGAKSGKSFEVRAQCSGRVKSRQGVTLVGKSFEVAALTDKDKEDVYQAVASGVDYIALSYVRRAADLRELRRLVDQYDPSIRLCAKIETKAALKDIDEIIKTVDLIMVARGDLGLQMDLEDVPMAQKHIIRRCARAGKPVITATQMLESMVTTARPTRAEATDVANAVLDGTDALMLSGETAAGQYPIESVKIMARIAERAEEDFDYDDRLNQMDTALKGKDLTTEAVAQAAVEIATLLKAKAIMTSSTSGLTPRMVSKFRPRSPILCMAWSEKTQSQLATVWGVESLSAPLPSNTDDVVHTAIDAFMRAKRLKVGDTVVVTAGIPAGHVGNTNFIQVVTI